MNALLRQGIRRAAQWGVVAAACLAPALSNAQTSVLWWDSTPDYGGQATNSLRQEMSDYLTAFSGGTVFNSTYVGSETAGTLATHLASNSYDVIVFDATSSLSKFNAADIAAVQAHYANNNKNILLDGTLYIRSISYDAGSNFPGPNGGTGGLLINEVYQLAARGGGLMIGTDHSGFQTDANQILNGILPSANFSGITYPSTDGVFFGSDLLNSKVAVAAADVFAHWDSVPTEAIAPTGAFTDFLGDAVTLYSQVDVADDPGGGTKYSYISTSWKPGSGTTVITDPNPGGGGGGGGMTPVPEPSTYAAMGAALLLGVIALRRRQARAAVTAAA